MAHGFSLADRLSQGQARPAEWVARSRLRSKDLLPRVAASECASREAEHRKPVSESTCLLTGGSAQI
jgi:hypothetical protein